ncbi:SpoIIE family protein phosphatase [Lentzea sp. NEAU-D13]|uniref:SpoIIE family protein phosphatase n=1 Tax=Lentzea alba TaxID=2714351 RepID=A0A7C9RQX7_9PSEU|nr:SpoIIE family protein phosphatase [Lentzea alba]NGY60367.1 SpoIIE family protein phosphatase [Lentzea alba]
MKPNAQSGRASSGPGGDARLRRTGDPEVVRDRVDGLSVVLVACEGPDQRLVMANESFRRCAGVSEPVGMTTREVLPEFESQRIHAAIDRVYQTGEAQTASEWRVQLDRQDDGEPRELYVDFVLEPSFHPDGTVRGVTACGFDVTGRVRRRQAEAARTADARYRSDTVVDLRAALLPTSLPVLPQARISARCLVAADDQAAGGDWFDAIARPDGRVVLVVGDVVGHGVAASAAMSQLRAVLKHLLFTTADLPAVLAQVNTFAARERALRAATLALVLLDPQTGKFSYSRCGHPAPLVVRANGTAVYLDGAASGPLGVGRTPVVRTGQLGHDDLVLLYSSGLVERPNRSLSEGTAELAAVASDAAMNHVLPKGAATSAAERVCELTVELLTRTGYHDDVTALAVQRLAEPVPPLSVRLWAELGELPAARHAVRNWLAELNADHQDHEVLELAVGEAVTNAVEHAYPTGPGVVHISAELLPDGICELRITDEGRWRAPDPASSERGHGLMLCEQLVDELTVTHPPQRSGNPVGARGTTVTVRHYLNQPTMIDSGTAASANDRAFAPYRAETLVHGDMRLVRVSGPIDAVTAAVFERDLLSASRGGVTPMTVDLSGVTHLASAGVRILYEVTDQLSAHQQRPTLIAPDDSPAAHVLDLVDLRRTP